MTSFAIPAPGRAFTSDNAAAPDHDLSHLNNAHVTLIVGPPRSGTSWLGKLFDSHPDVLYRHEPDDGLPPDALSGPARYVNLGRAICAPTLRAIGRPPVFDKSFQSKRRRLVYRTLLHGMRVLDRAMPTAWLLRALVRAEHRAAAASGKARVVIKSVRARGFTRAMIETFPGCRVVLILRHPCGQVASMLRGVELGKFASDEPIDDDLAGALAVRCGETRPWPSLPLIERLAWNWAAFIDNVLTDLRDYDAVRVVVFDELCERPEAALRGLFAFADLDWHPQTAEFVKRSSTDGGSGRYYGVFRKSKDVPRRWRSRLSPSDQATVIEIAARAGLARFVCDVDAPARPVALDAAA